MDRESIALLKEALDRLQAGFAGLPEFEPAVQPDTLRPVLLEVAARMQDNYPYQHPLYAGQMMKPPHPIARLAYALSLWINPNNHALDGGRASSAMEKEAVGELAGMFGWSTYLGHLCGGGTIANLEALWVSKMLRPGKTVVASEMAHYTHNRICGVLGVPFQVVACDNRARMDVDALRKLLDGGDVGTVVVTMGTTATGSVDPLPEVLELQRRYGFRIHADAAYGGYFTLVEGLAPGPRASFDRLHEVDSIAVDPHKHGLQPYGCGCILLRDPTVGVLYKHDSPYTYFSSSELHLGEISLECSRPGASAVALWATQRLLPLVRDGQFAAGLAGSRKAALLLYDRLSSDPRFLTGLAPDLDILVWAPRAQRASEVSRLSRAIFEAAASRRLHLALATLPRRLFVDSWPGVTWDQNEVICLRSCLMKSEHLDWIPSIWETLDVVAGEVLKRDAAA